MNGGEPEERIPPCPPKPSLEGNKSFSWKRMVVSVAGIAGIVLICKMYFDSPMIEKISIPVVMAGISAVAGICGYLVKQLTDEKK